MIEVLLNVLINMGQNFPTVSHPIQQHNIFLNLFTSFFIPIKNVAQFFFFKSLYLVHIFLNSVQLTQLCLILCDPMDFTVQCSTLQASWYITNSHSILKFMSIESVMPSNHLFLFHSLLLLPSKFLPSIRVFSNESVLCIRWPKY